MATTARGQITITDLNDARSLFFYLSTNGVSARQLYDPDDNATFTPDYTQTALVITPELYVSGSDDMIALSSLAEILWYVDDTKVTSSNAQSLGVALATGTDAGKLNVVANLTGSTVNKVIECRIKWLDSTSNLYVTAKAKLEIERRANSGQLVRPVITINGGEQELVTFHNGNPASIQMVASLKRGNETDATDVTYTWKNSAGTTLNTVSNKWTVTGNKLTVYPDGVDSMETFFCTMKDADNASTTYNKEFTTSVTIVDLSDPYQVTISATTQILNNSNGTAKLTCNVARNGLPVTPSSYKWSKLDANGDVDSQWSPNVSGQNKTSQTLTVNASDVTRNATFVCEVTIA